MRVTLNVIEKVFEKYINHDDNYRASRNDNGLFNVFKLEWVQRAINIMQNSLFAENTKLHNLIKTLKSKVVTVHKEATDLKESLALALAKKDMVYSKPTRTLDHDTLDS